MIYNDPSLRAKRGNPVATAGLDCRASAKRKFILSACKAVEGLAGDDFGLSYNSIRNCLNPYFIGEALAHPLALHRFEDTRDIGAGVDAACDDCAAADWEDWHCPADERACVALSQ